jgi:hypothetical protein
MRVLLIHLTPRHLAVTLLTAALMAIVAPAAYLFVQVVAALFGHGLFPPWTSLPEAMFDFWIVSPGAALLAAIVTHAMPLEWVASGPRIRQTALLGALLGPLNVPLSILVALVHYRTHGGGNPLWLGGSWTADLPRMILHSLPVSVPCGALLGALVGWLAGLRQRTPLRLS